MVEIYGKVSTGEGSLLATIKTVVSNEVISSVIAYCLTKFIGSGVVSDAIAPK